MEHYQMGVVRDHGYGVELLIPYVVQKMGRKIDIRALLFHRMELGDDHTFSAPEFGRSIVGERKRWRGRLAGADHRARVLANDAQMLAEPVGAWGVKTKRRST